MRIGVPTEIKPQELRVGLTPASVQEFVSHGHSVVVQSGAGAGIRAGDEVYIAAGAEIVGDAASVFDAAEMIIKVKEPQPSERAMLRDGQILYTYLHLAPDPDQATELCEAGVFAIAHETVTDGAGGLPLLAPMSEVAGRLAVQAAAQSLTATSEGRGILLGGVPGVLPAQVVVIGGGVVGLNAARMATGLGADVTVLDRSIARLREIDEMFDGRIRTLYSTRNALEEAVAGADAVIGAVLVAGARAPKLVTREMLDTMKTGAAIVDVAIDQGGCFETSHPTTHEDPTFVVDGVVHYCVANMPGAVPLTASTALNHATLAPGLKIADLGLAQALQEDPHLMNGLNVAKGAIVHPAVAKALNRVFVPPEEILSA